MLDRRFILENIELVENNCRDRGVVVDVRKLADLEHQRRSLQTEAEEANRQANAASKAIGKAANEPERELRKEEGRQLRAKKDGLHAEVEALEAQIRKIQSRVPNLSHPNAPVGADDAANLELKQGKTPVPSFNFDPKDHVELGDALDLFDFDAGGKVAGHGFYYLKNEAVLLELALQQFVMRMLIERNFTPIITPDLARTEILQGVGFIPRGPETQIYSIADSDLNLIATAEITLGGMYSDTILEREQLPIRMCGLSHCYRTEAGAAGRASRGLYRVHQFTKVEMFAFTHPEDSEKTLGEFCDIECEIFDTLGIPFRVVDTATGDLGGPAYRKFDLEAWMPGRGEAGAFGEVTSTSNCTDYQARRLGIRFKNRGEKGTHFVHTLNGTAIAISRALIAILENYQQSDGSVRVPDALQNYVGHEVIKPRP
ncbi:MAG: serine--tRNA ligase [Planctomycetaceae bacterium]|nr:serine--tRNA ligase [Planctomycetaceae bacterium]|tara:strand:+ start:1377 stop:2663 length:1287 start_codon:yes stop_codon:yes gene_type:complete